MKMLAYEATEWIPAVATELIPAIELPTRAPCPLLHNLEAGETLISWGSETEIRAGDMVMVEYCQDAVTETFYRHVGHHAGGLAVLPAAAMPPLPIEPGGRASNGIVEVTVRGVVRGTYLAFP